MRITESPQVIQQLVDSLQQIDEKEQTVRTKYLHVSDLVYCLRQSWFRYFEPQKPDVTQLSFYVDGARRHDIIEPLHPGKAEYAAEKYYVVAHIDVLNEAGIPAPVEVKTTRSSKGTPKDHYIRQLGYYCVIVESKVGWLIIQALLNFVKPFYAFKIEFTDDEWNEIKADLVWRRNLLIYSYYHKNIKILPIVPKPEAWKCKTCRTKLDCAFQTPTSITPELEKEINGILEVWLSDKSAELPNAASPVQDE